MGDRSIRLIAELLWGLKNSSASVAVEKLPLVPMISSY
jgi:hypothetical protein